MGSCCCVKSYKYNRMKNILADNAIYIQQLEERNKIYKNHVSFWSDKAISIEDSIINNVLNIKDTDNITHALVERKKKDIITKLNKIHSKTKQNIIKCIIHFVKEIKYE